MGITSLIYDGVRTFGIEVLPGSRGYYPINGRVCQAEGRVLQWPAHRGLLICVMAFT